MTAPTEKSGGAGARMSGAAGGFACTTCGAVIAALALLAACERVTADRFPGTATLSWEAVTTDTQGHPLGQVAGYHIRYGTSPAALAQLAVVADPAARGYVITNLAPGTWYFTVAAYTRAGTEGLPSPVREKTIR